MVTDEPSQPPSSGPLAGIRVLDLSALGPGPFATMVLADFGAEVIHVLRPGATGPDPSKFLRRGKAEIVVDLKSDTGVETIARMARHVDVIVEGNRPGAMERRGLGPESLLADNPRLVYTRLTGWGQSGPYATRAGHDINYLAVSGALGAIGTDEPVPPLALLGDLSAGSLMAVIGTILALFERERTGAGQVVDAAIVDGAALLLSAAFGELASGMWDGERGTHLLSGAAPFYGVYRCADDGWMSVGAIEPQFYRRLIEVIAPDEMPEDQWDQASWPDRRRKFEAVFATAARAEWEDAFGDVDACVAAVLDIDELDDDEHLAQRGTVRRADGRLQAGVAPRLSAMDHTERVVVTDVGEIMAALGFAPSEIDELTASGVLQAASGRDG